MRSRRSTRLGVQPSGARERPDSPRARLTRRQPSLLCQRDQDLGDVGAPFVLRAPHIGHDETVAGGIDDVSEQAGRWSTRLHHRFADAIVQRVELVLGCYLDAELKEDGHVDIVAPLRCHGQGDLVR